MGVVCRSPFLEKSGLVGAFLGLVSLDHGLGLRLLGGGLLGFRFDRRDTRFATAGAGLLLALFGASGFLGGRRRGGLFVVFLGGRFGAVIVLKNKVTNRGTEEGGPFLTK